MLLRIAKLYQMKDFDAESSFLLSDWVLEEYKHTKFEVIKQALTKPPLPQTKEKSWRLTPEVIGEWIETTRTKMIDEEQRKESEKRQTTPVKFPDVSDSVDKLLQETMQSLKKTSNVEPSQIANDVKAIEKKDRLRREGHKAVHHNRKNFTVQVEDENGKPLGVIENVLAISQEQANSIVKKLIESGNLKV